MSEEDKFTKKLIRGNREYTEEELAQLVSEDKRLVRLGLDPNADPVELMKMLDEKIAELEKDKK